MAKASGDLRGDSRLGRARTALAPDIGRTLAPVASQAIVRAKPIYAGHYQALVGHLDQGATAGTDQVLQTIQQFHGFDARPEMVTKQQMNQLIKAGAIELGKAEHVKQLADEFLKGDLKPGLGLHGSGTYFYDKNPARASSSAVDRKNGAKRVDAILKEDGRHQIRAVLKPGAKVISEGDLKKEIQQARKAGATRAETSNIGRYAAHRGYDAIFVPRGSHASPQYVVLNRTAVAVQRAKGRPRKDG